MKINPDNLARSCNLWSLHGAELDSVHFLGILGYPGLSACLLVERSCHLFMHLLNLVEFLML